MITLAQSQPNRADVKQAWEEAVQELAHTNVEIVFIEAKALVPPQLTVESASHPMALIDRWCAEMRMGKTVLNFVIGGGPAARFLITASAGLKLPTLWMPLTNRDFYKQVRVLMLLYFYLLLCLKNCGIRLFELSSKVLELKV